MGGGGPQDTAVAVSRDTVRTAVHAGRVSSRAGAERPAGCLRGAPLEGADARRPEQSPARHRQRRSLSAPAGQSVRGSVGRRQVRQEEAVLSEAELLA